MRAVFVMLKVEPGTLSQVADHLTELESFFGSLFDLWHV